jgi:SNF2 family DNA or RNA helicase
MAQAIRAALANDMGLGKTVQVIALHLHRVAAGRRPALVVCLTTLVANWEREVRRFAPRSRSAAATAASARSRSCTPSSSS